MKHVCLELVRDAPRQLRASGGQHIPQRRDYQLMVLDIG